MNDTQRKRVQSAIDEAMAITPNGDGTFLVKEKYTVDPSEPACSCPDHRHRNRRCKHIVRVKLDVLFGHLDTDSPDETAKPSALEVHTETIPRALREISQWVCWEYQWIADREAWTKVPVDVDNGGFASSTDPDTWTSFGAARDYHNREWTNTDGLGFVVTDEDTIVGIDYDDCRDPETERHHAWVAGLFRHLPTYTEVSPSGTGFRQFAVVDDESVPTRGHTADGPAIEVYSSGRYLTVTGHHVETTPSTVNRLESTTLDREMSVAEMTEYDEEG